MGLTRRTSWRRLTAAAVLVGSILLGTGPAIDAIAHSTAGAQQCVTFTPGTYIGTWAVGTGSVVSGVAGAVLDFSGTSVSGTISFITENGSFEAPSTTISGSLGCTSFTFSAPVDSALAGMVFMGGLASDGVTLVGSWAYPFQNGEYGTFIATLVADSVSSQGQVTSLSSGSTTSPSNPIQVTVDSPDNPGFMAIGISSAIGEEMLGYTILGQNIEIAAPSDSEVDPLTLVFTLDSSIGSSVPSMFRNGTLIPSCSMPALPLTSSTDPCIESSTIDPTTGDYIVTVLTSQASFWNVGSPCSYSITALLPEATTGEQYTAELLGCGGTPPYRFGKARGLPKGLHLKSNGEITGTPKRAGTYSISVKMTDSKKHAKDVTETTLSLTVVG